MESSPASAEVKGSRQAEERKSRKKDRGEEEEKEERRRGGHQREGNIKRGREHAEH